MANAISRPAISLRFFKRKERQLARAVEIAVAMFVMHRERFGGKASERAHSDDSADGSRLGQLH